MIIKALRVQNLCCLHDVVLECEPLTALVGPNGCGKSSFLRAIALFFALNPRFAQEDFYDTDTSQDIQITVTFTDLSEKAKEKFASYLDGSDLSITRVLSLAGGKPSAKFYGTRLQNTGFASIREASNATEARKKYNELRQDARYGGLPAAASREAVLNALKDWEQAHLEQCTRQRDDGQFFGFTEVAQGYLGRFVRFISIPAVRDASEEAAEGKGSAITALMDLMVRSALASRVELVQFKEEMKKRYEEITRPGNLTEIRQLEDKLTATLKTYVPEAGVKLAWLETEGIEIPMPRADVKLVEDGYFSPVSKTGHGLQRAFILTMLQHLAVAQTPVPEEAEARSAATEPAAELDAAASTHDVDLELPTLILGIEEPELYQHPNRQRHLAAIFANLAAGSIPGVSQRVQILYGTHSPLFVGLERFHQVRALRKVSNGADKPKVTRVTQVRGNEVAREIWEANDRKDSEGKEVAPFTWDTLHPHLHSIMTPWMGEGFFADTVVLVEGEDDRAAVIGTARLLGHNLESRGVSVIPCGGKCSLDRPLVIFRRFGIRTYVLWDGDKGDREAKPEVNHRLLRLMSRPVVDWPETQVTEQFACFETDLEHTLAEEIGEPAFDQLLGECQKLLAIPKRKHAMKNPVVVQRLLQCAGEQGLTCKTLQAVVEKILALQVVAPQFT